MSHTRFLKNSLQKDAYIYISSKKIVHSNFKTVIFNVFYLKAIVVLVLSFIFLFDSLREKRSVPSFLLVNSRALHVLKILAAHQLKITALKISKYLLHFINVIFIMNLRSSTSLIYAKCIFIYRTWPWARLIPLRICIT